MDQLLFFLAVEDQYDTDGDLVAELENRLHRKRISGKLLSSFCPRFWNTNMYVVLIEATKAPFYFYSNILNRWRGGSVKAGFVEF